MSLASCLSVNEVKIPSLNEPGLLFGTMVAAGRFVLLSYSEVVLCFQNICMRTRKPWKFSRNILKGSKKTWKARNQQILRAMCEIEKRIRIRALIHHSFYSRIPSWFCWIAPTTVAVCLCRTRVFPNLHPFPDNEKNRTHLAFLLWSS